MNSNKINSIADLRCEFKNIVQGRNTTTHSIKRFFESAFNAPVSIDLYSSLRISILASIMYVMSLKVEILEVEYGIRKDNVFTNNINFCNGSSSYLITYSVVFNKFHEGMTLTDKINSVDSQLSLASILHCDGEADRMLVKLFKEFGINKTILNEMNLDASMTKLIRGDDISKRDTPIKKLAEYLVSKLKPITI